MEFGIAIKQCGGKLIYDGMTEQQADAKLYAFRNVWIATYVKVSKGDNGWTDADGNIYTEKVHSLI